MEKYHFIAHNFILCIIDRFEISNIKIENCGNRYNVVDRDVFISIYKTFFCHYTVGICMMLVY